MQLYILAYRIDLQELPALRSLGAQQEGRVYTQNLAAGDVISIRPYSYNYKAVVQGKAVSRRIKGPPYVRGAAGSANGFAVFGDIRDPGDERVLADIQQVRDNRALIKIRWPTATKHSNITWLISGQEDSAVYVDPRAVYLS